MTNQCPKGFDEQLLSGYLDDELNQSRQQRVELHIQECEICRVTLEQLRTIREVAMKTQFETPSDDAWGELPRGLASRATRGFGWIFLILWFVIMVGFGLYQFLSGPEDLWLKMVTVGGLLGLVLLFLSVLIDRIRTMKSDRYREVDL
ncbi:MAG TPA: zf-HC2 domain-containing protein [Thermoanaerobaculia bacterium]|nr:zf-HC2 domain-containing protein [Thermoanaerobaculia bacterium]HXK69105.1 zf-HC2 domain-containing protein [Thermoanaerobaculia bacterium]